MCSECGCYQEWAEELKEEKWEAWINGEDDTDDPFDSDEE